MLTHLNNIRIVLVNPTHPGNIGATARAMKTMGLERLYLVGPKKFPDALATERAANAFDVLEQAKVFDNLFDAIRDCKLVFGTSARVRSLEWPHQEIRPGMKQAVTEANLSEVAIVFGCEQSGLNNEELELCHYQLSIPANPAYSSLNIASAVQIICYELRMAWLELVDHVDHKSAENLEHEDWVSVEAMDLYYQHLEKVLSEIDFIKPGLSGQVIPRLRRLFSRTRLDTRELNILRGILTATEKALENKT